MVPQPTPDSIRPVGNTPRLATDADSPVPKGLRLPFAGAPQGHRSPPSALVASRGYSPVNDLDGRLVAHVSDTGLGPVSGLADRLHQFAEAGLRAVVVSPAGLLAKECSDRGIPHVRLRHEWSSGSSGSSEGSLAALVELIRLLRTLTPDIVHIHGPGPGRIGRAAARAAGVPGIVHTVPVPVPTPVSVAASGDPSALQLVSRGLERLAIACSHVELIEDPADLAALARLRIPADRAVLVGTGVDIERFRPRRAGVDIIGARAILGVDPSAVVVGLVGSGATSEDLRSLLIAAPPLQAPRRNIAFVMMDDPVDGQHADWLGHREDLHAGIDLVVVVVTSPDERLSRSAMEAVASGLPVIAVDSPAGRRAVCDGANGRNGVLVPPEDLDALVSAVVDLADDPARRGTFGARSRARAESMFDERAVVRSVLDAYRRLPMSTRPTRTERP